MPDVVQAREPDRAMSKGTVLAILALVIVAAMFVMAWFRVPENDSLVDPVAPAVEREVGQAIEAATDPAERANLRLELARLEQDDAARRIGLRNSIAQVGTAFLAGLAAAWGAVAAWQQMQTNRRHTLAAQKDTAEQLRLARDAQLSERFTRAVDQLGHDSLDVRLGGIYSLNRIAVDSERDRSTIIEVLAGFVRGSTTKAPVAEDVASEDRELQEEGWTWSAFSKILLHTPTDLRAALTVLAELNREGDERRIELSDTNLHRFYLSSLNLSRANFLNADLSGSLLFDANLSHAFLALVDLSYASASGSDLTGATFKMSDLSNALLANANLSNADLEGADLSGATLRNAVLEGADLSGATLWNADLTGATVNAKTKWPDGFDLEAAGVIFADRSKPPDELESDVGQE